jgi:type VI secretion system secreted protein Hcp
MAVDMFLKIDGIKGESKDHKHKDEIHVESFSWGATNMGTQGSGGGGGAGKVNVQDFIVTKLVDASSADLFLSCAGGKHIPKAEFVVRKAGEKPLEYLKIKMSDILISSIQQGGNNGGDLVTESLSINYAKIEFEYAPQDSKGAGGAPSKAGWDVKGNTKV